MAGITTEHRGYTISYSENADEWTCYDCGVSHQQLSKVKAKIRTYGANAPSPQGLGGTRKKSPQDFGAAHE